MSTVHLHLILNHVPVIGMAFVLLILGVSIWRRNDDMGKLGMAVLVGMAVITAAVFLTGEPAEEAVEGVVGVSDSMIHPHEAAAEASLIATAISGALALLVLFTYWRRSLPRWMTGAVLAASLITATMLGWTANLGGQIRHTEIGRPATPADKTNDDERR